MTTTYDLPRWTAALAAALGLGLLFPSGTSAQAIRVLLVMPTESGRLSRQVAEFDAALGMPGGPLLRARTLDEADAIVHFTGYRRAIDGKGESEDWWEGQFKLLTPPVPRTGFAPAVPEHFKLLVIGRPSWYAEPAVELLARTLERALGREARPKKDGRDQERAAGRLYKGEKPDPRRTSVEGDGCVEEDLHE
jgi:hypothetical protein